MKCSRDLWTNGVDLLKHSVVSSSAAHTAGAAMLTEVVISAESGRLLMYGNDTQTEVKVRIPCDGDLAPTAVPWLSLSKLTKASKRTRGEEMAVDNIDTGLRLAIAGRVFDVTRGEHDERKQMVDDWGESAAQHYAADDFAAALAYVSPACCSDPSRTHMHAVHFTDSHLMACDGHRLHAVRDIPSFDRPLSIHPATADALQSALRYCDHTWVMARANRSHVQFDVGGVLLDALITARIAAEEFPPWREVTPKHEKVFAIEAAAFSESMATARKLAGSESVLMVAHKECLVTIEKLFSEVLALEWRPPEEFEGRFNPKYLLEAAAGSTELVRIEYADEHSPLLIRPNDDAFAVVMPCRGK